MFIWKDNDSFKIIDGHQRLKALYSLRDDGYEIPLIPVAYINAIDNNDAREKLLAITSQYGDFDFEELYDFINNLDDEISEIIRLVNGEIKFKKDIEFENENDHIAIKKEKKIKCPNCAYEILVK